MAMKAFSGNQTVGAIVIQNPNLSRIFESLGVDYGNDGKKTLEAACRQKALRLPEVLGRLEAAVNGNATKGYEIDLEGMTLSALADHIVRTHHDYLRHELPRLEALMDKVSSAHGGYDRRLVQVRDIFASMASEMNSHMWKEEQILFPLVNRFEANDLPTNFRVASLAYPIRQIELEHFDFESALERIQVLTDNFVPPERACNTYRVMLDALSFLQQDLCVHIQKENNALFPRALELEAQRDRSVLVC
jgi:regulator of cell morphogenesis and NO signaling